jgi:hypothetical protein
LALAITYYFMMFLPANQKARVEFQNCLREAQNQADRTLPADAEPAEGNLAPPVHPSYIVVRLQREFRAAQKECRQLYEH